MGFKKKVLLEEDYREKNISAKETLNLIKKCFSVQHMKVMVAHRINFFCCFNFFAPNFSFICVIIFIRIDFKLHTQYFTPSLKFYCVFERTII